MEDNRNIHTIHDDDLGEVRIADDVVAIIAGLAATEVEGVAAMYGNITNELVSKLGMNSVRISLNATNLFTITGYDGYDPEIGASTASANVFNLDNGRYPSPTTVTFNLNLSF